MIVLVKGIADLDLRRAMERHIAWVVDYCGGDVEWAASELGVDRTTIWRWARAGKVSPHLFPKARRGKAADEPLQEIVA